MGEMIGDKTFDAGEPGTYTGTGIASISCINFKNAGSRKAEVITLRLTYYLIGIILP